MALLFLDIFRLHEEHLYTIYIQNKVLLNSSWKLAKILIRNTDSRAMFIPAKENFPLSCPQVLVAQIFFGLQAVFKECLFLSREAFHNIDIAFGKPFEAKIS